jgi:vesicle coat complex subunit
MWHFALGQVGKLWLILTNTRRRPQFLVLCLLVTGCGGNRVEELLAHLKDTDLKVRRAAARELALENLDSARVVEPLSAAAADSDPDVRRFAMTALEKLGPAAKPALPALRRALQDNDPSVRLKAALALATIDPMDRNFEPALIDAIKQGDGRTILAVGQMGPDAKWAVPTLVALLAHNRPQVRAVAAQSLGRIGPSGAAAIPALQKSLADPNPAVKAAAKLAIEKLHAAASSVPANE